MKFNNLHIGKKVDRHLYFHGYNLKICHRAKYSNIILGDDSLRCFFPLKILLMHKLLVHNGLILLSRQRADAVKCRSDVACHPSAT